MAEETDEELAYGSGRRLRDFGPRSWASLAVVAALAATALWYFNRPAHTLVLTSAGRPVDNAVAVLAGADAAFVSYTRDNHGSLSARSRCYFDRVGGRSRTDVSPDLYCGPVLFYGGSAPAMYLRFVITRSGPRANGHVRLEVQSQPESRTAARLPNGAGLERPDGRTPPAGADGLVAPPPPPVAVDALLRVRATDLPGLPAAPASSIIGARDVEIALKSTGVVAFYGRGSRARSAPYGAKLLAFRLDISQGDVAYHDTTDPLSLGLAVNGGPARPLPLPVDVFDIQSSATTATGFLVAAVPARARDVDLVVADAGITQRMSILTGRLGAGNITILSRPGRDRWGQVEAAPTGLARITSKGRQSTAGLDVGFAQPYLGYYSPYGPQHAGGIHRALLNIDVAYQSPALSCPGSQCDFSFAARNLTLVPTGGRPIHAFDSGGAALFDVPASFHTGTVIVSGTASSHGSTVTLIHPYQAAISFPD